METKYTLKRLMEILGKNQFALLLRIILDRIPVIIIGKDHNEIDNFLNGLIAMAPHRHEYIFWSDFIENDEYLSLTQEEDNDFSIPRNVFCAPTNASKHLFNRIERFRGWIIGFEISNGISQEGIIANFKKYEERFLIILIEQNELKLSLFGVDNNINLDFERHLIEKSISKCQIALEKMKRVLTKKIKTPPSNDVMTAIMRFDIEEEKIRSNIFIQEIQTFIQFEKELPVMSSPLE